MIYSMTGYGAGRCRLPAGTLDVEIRTVNGRFCEVRCSMPEGLLCLEPDVLEQVRAGVVRGQISVHVAVHQHGGAHRAVIDERLAESVVRQLARVARKLSLQPCSTMEALLHVPELVKVEEYTTDADALRAPLHRALQQAMQRVLRARAQEGAALVRDVQRRMARVAAEVRGIERAAPDVPQEYRRRLERRLKDVTQTMREKPDPIRLLTEIGVFSERVDISEEVTRMQSHIQEFSAALARGGEIGKRLDFILQELFREINTSGAKANSAAIARRVIAIKEELEKMREQVQNIE